MGSKPWHKLSVLVVLSAAIVGCNNSPQKDKTIGSTYGNPPSGKSQSAQNTFPTAKPLDTTGINGQPKLPLINGPLNTGATGNSTAQPLNPGPFNPNVVPNNPALFNPNLLPNTTPNGISGPFPSPGGGFATDRPPPPAPVAPPPNFSR